MKNYVLISMTAIVLIISGCAQTPAKSVVPQAMGGSKADGTIKLGYETSPNAPAIPDWEGAKQEAVKRCKAWGYTKVDEFSGTETECIEMGAGLLINGVIPGVCARQNIYKNYQCLN